MEGNTTCRKEALTRNRVGSMAEEAIQPFSRRAKDVRERKRKNALARLGFMPGCADWGGNIDLKKSLAASAGLKARAQALPKSSKCRPLPFHRVSSRTHCTLSAVAAARYQNNDV